MVTAHELWTEVEQRVTALDERWGQAMFNVLQQRNIDGIEACRGSLWDPFYRIKTRSSLYQWVGRHVVVDPIEGFVVCVKDAAWA